MMLCGHQHIKSMADMMKEIDQIKDIEHRLAESHSGSSSEDEDELRAHLNEIKM